MNRANSVKIFLISCFLATGQSLLHDGFAKVFGSIGTATNVRTTQLLNQLCNESQDNNTTKRDACYGCFFRSSQQTAGYPMLLSMASCADSYLNDTEYGHCQGYLRNAANAINERANPTTIYCTFLECVRQVNKDNLDALAALYREQNPGTDEGNFIARKTKSALIVRQYIIELRGVCKPRRIDEGFNGIRPGAEPMSSRSNNFIDPHMRGRGPKNVFQFFIDGRAPQPAFRQYDRMRPREDAMFPYKSNYGDLPAGPRYYK